MSADPEVIVIGAGPNGLFAACRLARAGLGVRVLEASPHPGGALWDLPTTEPGFHHDVGAGFIAFRDSEAFSGLELESHGLRWALAPIESAHPALDGSCAVISRDLELSAATFGGAADGEAWRRLQRLHTRIEPQLMQLLGPLPQISPALRMGPLQGLRLASCFARSSAGLARHLFTSEAARRVIPAMGLHVDVGPHDRFGAGIAYVLAMRASTSGYAIPVGGAGAITRALLAELEAHGGELQLNARVEAVRVAEGRAVGVTLADGQQLDASGCVLANTSAPSLYLGLLSPEHVPSRIVASMRRFPQGWGTFKIDFALDGPVPWSAEPARRAAVVHVGESLQDLDRFTQQVRAGHLPEQPYLVIGQHTLADPSRAPRGKHTLYVYTHAPSVLDEARYPGGWAIWREHLADVIKDRIEWLAPGFAQLVRRRAISDPCDLERSNANLIGGDLGGGSNQWWRQLIFRPVFPYFRYRTPVSRLYLGSSYTHPGAGVHGMCGWNAAGMALRDLA
ncbi:MAG TPA: NAD(P)/FAD-dependent oxidoreductase [Deltaproteobacteria bacterium]|nr:NAD(P)/FAD-dependent oxidoreductase [Deltaproteobacteria bacterium]